MKLPNTHFGTVGKKPVAWREAKIKEMDDDDQELAETPKDVLLMLGFDPLEMKTIAKKAKKK